jgi:hypothetical protein
MGQNVYGICRQTDEDARLSQKRKPQLKKTTKNPSLSSLERIWMDLALNQEVVGTKLEIILSL